MERRVPGLILAPNVYFFFSFLKKFWQVSGTVCDGTLSLRIKICYQCQWLYTVDTAFILNYLKDYLRDYLIDYFIDYL